MDPHPERDAYLDSVLIGGREPADIQIVGYQETWPIQFADIARRVADALGATALTIEHIGSTAVPGLAAKPIIDVLVTVADVNDEGRYVPAMEQAGFVLRVREADHRMFRTPERATHLHFYEPGNQAVPDYLDLRDWLRHDAGDRDLYARTKQGLTSRPWSDMNHYADAKSEVIQAVLDRARQWRTGQV